MPDKTEAKIEELIRKIIKDKLDDGSLTTAVLPLKDLDSIAKAFMKVFSGVFHSREEYPDIKKKEDSVEDVNNENEQKDQNPKTESLE